MILTLAISLLMLGQASQTPVPVPTGSIEGRVLRAGTNQPLEGAGVMFSLLAPPDQGVFQDSQEFSETTDRSGRFVIRDLKPGSYVASAEREGYAAQVYGSRSQPMAALVEAMRGGLPTEDSMGAVATVIKLAPGQTLRNIVFSLIPSGVISGRIQDLDGRPLLGVRVKMIPEAHDAGGARVVSTLDDQAAETDDRGEFRLLDAAPGRYYVVADAPRSDVADKYGRHTFYPGVSDFARALTVEATSGREMRLPTFSLQPPLQTYKISGRVLDKRVQPKSDDSSIHVTVVSRHAGGMLDFSDLHDATLDSDGSFTVDEVPPGSYWVAAYSDHSEDLSILGVATIDAVHSDIGGVSLRLVDPISIRGSVTVDGKRPAESLAVERMRIGLEFPEVPFYALILLASRSSKLESDGTFSINGLFPGEFRPFTMSLPPDMYVKGIRFGGADGLSHVVGLSGPTSDLLQIDLGSRGGRLSGTLVDEKGKPLSDFQAVLIPRSDNDRADLFKTAYSDAAGRYVIRGIAPGDYTILAWKNPQASYFDSNYVRGFTGEGKAVHISEGSIETVNVQVIPSR